MEKTTLTMEVLTNHLPKRLTLSHVDYRESLEHDLEALQTAMSLGDLSHLYEVINDDDYGSHSAESEQLEELKISIGKTGNFTKEEIDKFFDENEDEILDKIRNLDDSDVLKDLIRNTERIIVFYRTDANVGCETWNWDHRRRQREKKELKYELGIGGINKWDNDIIELINNASYGGDVNIYFEIDVAEFFKAIDEGKEFVTFYGTVAIGLVNSYNGSGHSTYLHEVKEGTFKFPLEHERFHVEKQSKYNWTYDIAGMVGNWSETTVVKYI